MVDSTPHVHFDQTVINDGLHDNSIIYQVAPDGTSLTVHLGFLQINHRYRIELSVPAQAVKDVGFVADGNSAFVTQDVAVPNVHCRLVDFPSCTVDVKGAEHYTVTVEFFAHKEKLLKEHLHLCGREQSDRRLELILIARVLGKGKGTPMLRNGIHCIGVEKTDEESEMSDWQGFGRDAK
uniref:Adipose-secreted signaling protein n=1 Tax=Anopheles dirus TaxID=7168 RepID=A0A182NRP8_9DIPT